jgi:hypothetical protein
VRSLPAAVIVSAAALAATTAGAAAAPACTLPQARAAVASAKPRIPGPANGLVTVAPGSVDRVICFDFTRDGRTDLAMTVASGGTAGDIGWLVLRRTGAGWRLALGRNGYKVGIVRLGGDVADTQPVYRSGDPNCCPTGGFDHQRYHWSGSSFVVVRTWHTKTYRP